MASVEAVQHKQRVAKAISSLKAFGLTKTDILPTLNNLLEMFNHEWGYIEAENYRTLIDSIFEAQDAQTSSGAPAGGRPVTRRSRRATSASDDSDYGPSPPRGTSPAAGNPPAAAAAAPSRRSSGRLATVPVKKSDSPAPAPARGDNASVARAVDYHSAASVRTRAATLSLQSGGEGSPGTRGRVVDSSPASASASASASAPASASGSAAAALERDKGKSPLVPESPRSLPPQCNGQTGRSNLVTVKLEVPDSFPAPEGFEKVAFEKVGGVIQVKTPNVAGASPRPAQQVAPPCSTRANIAGGAPVQSDTGNQVFSPVPLLTKDPTSYVTAICVKAEPQEANAGPPDLEYASLDQVVQRELSLEVSAPLSPAQLQMVLHGTVFPDDSPPHEKSSTVTPGPFFEQSPRVELEEQDMGALPMDDIEDNVLSLVDYEDDADVSAEEETRSDGPLEQVEPHELDGAKIRPHFIVSGSKRDSVEGQIATDPKRQKCNTNTHSEIVTDNIQSAPSIAPPRRRLILPPSPSPDHRANGGSTCTALEGPSSTAGVKRKLGIPCPEGPVRASKEICASNGHHNTLKNGDSAKAAAPEERGRGALAARGQGSRNSTVSRMILEPGVAGPNAKQLKHNPADISRGTERIPIPFVNEFTSETIDSKFNYIPNNVVYQSGYFNISLARIGDEDCCVDCVGDCLNAPHSCPCTRETGGVFAYTMDGLLKADLIEYGSEHTEKVYCASGWACPIERAKTDYEPDKCKGHLVRKFIKECWHKCGCSMRCGNRVVQRGIKHRLQVFFTNDGKGWGLRTIEDLPAGSFVCEYVGEIMTNMELDQRNQEVKKVDLCGQAGSHKDTYPVLLDADWCSERGLKDEEALCLDATRYGNVARFINHRCMDANLIDVPVSIEGLDRHYYHVAFFTSRAVQAGEELTWDYKIDFEDEEHPIEAFRCLCQSAYCRGARTSGSKKPKK